MSDETYSTRQISKIQLTAATKIGRHVTVEQICSPKHGTLWYDPEEPTLVFWQHDDGLESFPMSAICRITWA
jgi:hypothetical protein